MTEAERKRKSAVRFIVFLGVVSLFADMTYEGSRGIVGPFLNDLGANAAQVGLIAGFGEMLAASLRLFSGRFADRTRVYWTITFAGYGLNVVVVPALAFALNWWMAALLVAAERMGKALRGPARDVLLSQATAEVGHGWGFGLHSALDQAGAVVGPLIVAAIVARSHHFGPAFLSLIFPAALTLISLVAAKAAHPERGVPPPRKTEQLLPKVFWPYVFAAGLLACGFLDFPLLSYHFQRSGFMAPQTIPLLYSGAMAVNGLTALIYGRLFDRFGLKVLSFGILAPVLALPLGFLFGKAGAIASVICWGAGMGLQDATLRAGIARVVSMDKRGSAFGSFNAVYGVMWFAGSVAMGALYDRSVTALVAFGIAAQLIAAVMFLRLRRPLAEATAK